MDAVSPEEQNSARAAHPALKHGANENEHGTENPKGVSGRLGGKAYFIPPG